MRTDRRTAEDGEKRTAGRYCDGVSSIVMSYPSDQSWRGSLHARLVSAGVFALLGCLSFFYMLQNIFVNIANYFRSTLRFVEQLA